MAKYKRLIRIYRFYIIGTLFCVLLPNLVLRSNDIYKILYTIPTLTIIFYPIYSIIILYSDILFLVDFLYFYINPTYEVLLRLKNSKEYLFKKIILYFIIILLKYLLINILTFNKLLLLSCMINIFEELFVFYLFVKFFRHVSLDRTIIIVLIILMVLKQFLNPLFMIQI